MLKARSLLSSSRAAEELISPRAQLLLTPLLLRGAIARTRPLTLLLCGLTDRSSHFFAVRFVLTQCVRGLEVRGMPCGRWL